MDPIENQSETGYRLWNGTDGVYAAPEAFATRAEARAYAAAFRKRYEVQGYYLTSDGLRIAPKHIELVIEPPPMFS
jgi:hypothetical protein